VRELATGLPPGMIVDVGLLNATVLFIPGLDPKGLVRLEMPDTLEHPKLFAGAFPPPVCDCV